MREPFVRRTVRWCVTLLAVLALAYRAGVRAYSEFEVGVLVPDNSFGRQSKVVLEIWRRYCIEKNGIGTTGLVPKFVQADIGTSPALASTYTEQMALGQYPLGTPNVTINFFLAAFSTTFTEPSAVVTEKYSRILVSGGANADNLYRCDTDRKPPCKESTGRRFQYHWGMQTPASLQGDGFIALMKIRGATSVVVLSEDGVYPLSFKDGIAASAGTYGLLVRPAIVIPAYTRPTNRSLTDSANDKLVAALQELANRQAAGTFGMGGVSADVLVMSGYQDLCTTAIPLLEKMNLYFRAIHVGGCLNYQQVNDEVSRLQLRYLYSNSHWDSRLSGPDYNEPDYQVPAIFSVPASLTAVTDGSFVPSPEQFVTRFLNVSADLGISGPDLTPPDQGAAGFYGACAYMHAGIAAANSTDVSAVCAQLNVLFLASAYGILATDRYGSNRQKVIITYQSPAEGNVLNIVTPLSAARADPIFPMPTWQERTYASLAGQSTYERVMLGVVVFGIGVATAVAALTIYARESADIRRASLPFCLICLVGIIICFSTVLMWGLDNTAAMCSARMWAMPIGAILVFSPLFAKSLRILLIFRGATLQRSLISDRQLFGYVAGALTPQIIICIAWASAAPLVPILNLPDPIRPALGFNECASPNDFPAFFAAAYAALVLIATFVVAVALNSLLENQVRMNFEFLHDARQLVFAVYVLFLELLVLSAIQLAVPSTTPSQRNGLYLIRSVGIVSAFFISMMLMFAPLLWSALGMAGKPQPTGPQAVQLPAGPRTDGLAAISAAAAAIGRSETPALIGGANNRSNGGGLSSPHAAAVNKKGGWVDSNAPDQLSNGADGSAIDGTDGGRAGAASAMDGPNGAIGVRPHVHNAANGDKTINGSETGAGAGMTSTEPTRARVVPHNVITSNTNNPIINSTHTNNNHSSHIIPGVLPHSEMDGASELTPTAGVVRPLPRGLAAHAAANSTAAGTPGSFDSPRSAQCQNCGATVVFGKGNAAHTAITIGGRSSFLPVSSNTITPLPANGIPTTAAFGTPVSTALVSNSTASVATTTASPPITATAVLSPPAISNGGSGGAGAMTDHQHALQQHLQSHSIQLSPPANIATSARVAHAHPHGGAPLSSALTLESQLGGALSGHDPSTNSRVTANDVPIVWNKSIPPSADSTN